MSPRLRNILLAIVVLALGAIAVHWLRAPVAGPAPAPAARAACPIAFDPPEVRVGELLPGQKVTATVHVRNLTDAPVAITHASADCGCTTPTWPHDPIPPHGQADTAIAFDPGDKQGYDVAKRVTFLVADFGPVVLSVTGHVGTVMRFSPEVLDAPAAPAPGDRSAPIVLEAADGTAFLLASVDPPVVADAPKQPTTRAEVHLDWDAWHRAGRPITVTITTDHPKAPPFRLVIKRPLLPAGTPPAPGAPAKPAPPAHDDPDPDAMPGP
jgi:hypothetical protein